MVELRANVTFAPTTAAVSLHARIGIVDSPPGNLAADVDFNQEAAVLLQPTLQLVNPGDRMKAPLTAISWKVGGVDPGTIFTADDIAISADLDSCSRSWKATVVAASGTRANQNFVKSPLGYELDTGGPPPGYAIPVDFALDLIGQGPQAGTSVLIPLLTGGYSNPTGSSERTNNRDGHVMTLQGGGREALFQATEIDLKLPSGHGNTHGELVILAMKAGSQPVPDELIGIDPTIGAPRTVALDIQCRGRWDVIHEIFRPLGLVVMASPTDGVFRAVSFDVRDTAPAVLTIGPKDIEWSSGITTSASSLDSTCFTVTGTRLQDTSTGSGSTSGTVTKTVQVEVINNAFRLPIAVASQAAGSGAITPSGSGGLGPPTVGVVTNRVTVSATTTNGCPSLTYTKTEQFFNPKVARYIAATSIDGEPKGYQNGFFFETIPGVDDTQAMFGWQTERFSVFSETWEIPQFETVAGNEGVRAGTLTRSGGWLNPEAEIKNRISQGSPWETENYVGGRFLTESLSGVLFDRQRYFGGPLAPDALFPSGLSPIYPGLGLVVSRYLQVVDDDKTVDECLYETAFEVETTAYARRRGQLHLYADGSSALTGNVVGLSSSTRTDRLDLDPGFQVVKTGTDIEGDEIPVEVTDGASQGLPTAQVCTSKTLDRARQETFNVDAVCVGHVDPSGETITDFSRPDELQSIYVETEAEATDWALLELALLISPEIKVALASPNPTLDAGQNVTLDLPEDGYPGKLVKIIKPETTIGAEGTRHVLNCKINLLV